MTYRLSFALALFAALASLGPARADNACIDRCFSNFSPMQNGGSTELRRECLEQCNGSSVSYGAIAYGAKSTANGFAYDKDSVMDANRTAMSNCQQHGDDCRIVVSFSKGCAAVAAVEAKNRFATGQGGSRNLAQANAIKACQSQVGGSCEIEAWTCD